MKQTTPKSIWIWHGIFPWRLTGQELALALLLRNQPLTAPQLCAKMREANGTVDLKALSKALSRLERHGVIAEENGVYTCRCRQLDSCAAYPPDQLLDLLGLTQNTVHGHAFFSAAPPMSSSSAGGRVS